MTKNFKYLLLILFVNCANIGLCKPRPNYDSPQIEDNVSTTPSADSSSSSNPNNIINPVGGYGHPKHTIRYSDEQLNLPNDYLINSNSEAVENKQQYHQPAINVNGQHQNQDQNNNIDKYNIATLHTINNQNQQQQQQNNEQNYYGHDIKNIDDNYLPYYLNKNENFLPSLSSYDQNVNSNLAIEQKMYEDYARELLECMKRHRYNLLNNIMAYRREYQQQLEQEYDQQYGRRNSPGFLDHQNHQQMYDPRYNHNSNNNPFIEYQGNSNTRISDLTKYKQNNLPEYYNGFNMVPNDQNSFVQKQQKQQQLNDNDFNSYGY